MESNIFNEAPLRMIDLNPMDVFLGMLLAFALNFILAKISTYANKSNSVNSSSSLQLSMVLLGTVVSLIMSVIGNSLARAFGAIGALSLIRFRTAVKEPLDLVQLFMTISIGMTTGSGHFVIACGATVIFGVFLAIADYLPLKRNKNEICLIKMKYEPDKEKQDKILALVKEYSINYNVLSMETLAEKNICEAIIEVTCIKIDDLEGLLPKLKEVDSNINAVIINN